MPVRLRVILFVWLVISIRTEPCFSQSYRFVQLTDLHITSEESKADLQAVLQAVHRLQPPAEFILVTGDLTDMGSPAEITALKEIMGAGGFRYHLLLGNHDSRWSGFSQQQLETLLERPSHFCLPWHGLYVIGLNSALPLEAWGDIDAGQVDWLCRTVDKKTPLILASHHPPTHPTRLYMSDNPLLFSCLDSLQTTLFLMGHGHRSLSWWHNGIAMQMAPAVVRSRAFLVVTLRGDSLHLQSMTAGQPEGGTERSLPLFAADTCRLSIASLEQTAHLVHGNLRSSPGLLDDGTRWQYRRNQGVWVDMTTPTAPNLTVTDSSRYWHAGVNVLTVRVQRDSQHFYQHQRTFVKEDAAVKVLWRKELRARIQAPLQVVDDRLILADGSGRLVMIDAQTGAEIRRLTLPGSVIKGLTQGDNALFVATTAGSVSRYEAAEGKMIWQIQLDAAVTAAPRYLAGKLYVATGSGRVYEIDAADGKIGWSFPAGDHIQQQPCATENRLFFGSWDRKFYALNRITGSEEWSHSFTGSPYFAPATAAPTTVADRIIFIRAVPTPGMPTVYACHVDSGDTLWTWPTASHYCSPLVVRDRVILGGIEGLLYALDWRNGRPLWQTPVGEELFDSAPILSHGDIFIATLKGTLLRVCVDSGAIKGRYQVGDGLVFADIAAHEDTIFAAEVDGGVTALKITERN